MLCHATAQSLGDADGDYTKQTGVTLAITAADNTLTAMSPVEGVSEAVITLTFTGFTTGNFAKVMLGGSNAIATDCTGAGSSSDGGAISGGGMEPP